MRFQVEAKLDESRARTRALETLLETPAQAAVGATWAAARGGGEVERVQTERVASLERQVEALRRLLQSRGGASEAKPSGGAASHGTDGKPAAGRRGQPSVAELVAAAGPSEAEVQRAAYLTARVDELEAACAEAEGATQRRLRSLRQQHERVVAGYEARLASVTASLRKLEAAEAAAAKGGPCASRWSNPRWPFGGSAPREVYHDMPLLRS